MVGTEKLSRVMWCKLLDIWFLVPFTCFFIVFSAVSMVSSFEADDDTHD